MACVGKVHKLEHWILRCPKSTRTRLLTVLPDIDIGIKSWFNNVVCTNNLLYFSPDEIIKRFQVLLHQTSDLHNSKINHITICKTNHKTKIHIYANHFQRYNICYVSLFFFSFMTFKLNFFNSGGTSSSAGFQPPIIILMLDDGANPF